MRKLLVVALSLLVAPLAWAQTEKPLPAVEHVLIISVDGMRPDLMLRAETPNFRALMNRGSYSMWARTIPEAITLPSHTSMVTGVSIVSHGVDWNDDRPADKRTPCKVPTIFQLAKKQGLSSALIAGKSKFITLAVDVDQVFLPDEKKQTEDSEIAATAVKVINAGMPNVLFVHFAKGDSAGHGTGWGSPEQIAVFEGIDKGIGSIITALNEGQLNDSTVVIVTADHGGAGKGHGKDDARSRHIPWIAVGPGIQQGYDLTQIKELEINTQDTFATTCWLLGIPTPELCEGKPVKQILSDQPAAKKDEQKATPY